MTLHHVGLRVADLDRATAFYRELGGEVLAPPLALGGRGAALAMAASPGIQVRIVLLAFPGGGGVELFEFDGDTRPDWLQQPQADARLPHVGIEVDDVDAALDRAERAGGTRLWPAPSYWGPVRVVYLHDPDGNVVELLDDTLAAVAAVAGHNGGG